MSQNLVEKIVQKFAVGLEEGQKVQAGDFVSIQPDHIMTHDNTGAVIPKFKSIGATKMANPRQPVYTLDHKVTDKSEENLAKYAKIEAFAKEMGVDFYPAGRGIGHQIMCEEGYAFPGGMAVASDSHSNTYGGLGCLGTPIVRTDAAAIWATGKTWWQIPPVAKVKLIGKLQPGVTGKDFIIFLCGYFNHDEVLNHAIEFTGEGVKTLSVEQRLAVANMTTEWGALVGLFPIDDVTINWMKNRCDFIENRGLEGVPSDADGNGQHPRINKERMTELESNLSRLRADEDAYYAKELVVDLSKIQPYVSGPHTLKVMNSIKDIRDKNIKIDKAYLVSCVNSRVDDLAEAAAFIKGKKVADHVKMYIAAASREVQAESEKRGDWQTLIDAGAIPLIPGCGQCIGLGEGLLEDGEVGISATNRNFKGRMGSKNAEAYLGSPAVVAASAVAGKIDFPGNWGNTTLDTDFKTNKKVTSGKVDVKIMDGFPAAIEGDIIFCHQDNMNTDGIYPGKYTYIDDFTPEQQAGVVMENYDGEFVNLAKDGDILVGGYNFGTGSSREQAATALKYKGIRLVLAGSFSQTYKRNAINNGFLVLEAPELVNDLKSKYGNSKLTIATAIKAKIDFTTARMEFDGKSYALSPVGLAAQELVLSAGLENWVKERI